MKNVIITPEIYDVISDLPNKDFAAVLKAVFSIKFQKEIKSALTDQQFTIAALLLSSVRKK